MKRAFLNLVLSAVLVAPAFAAVQTAFAPTAAAQAEQSVMVLGVRSLEGDDEFTRNLTGAVRHAASQVDGWQVSEREVTFVQMALVHDCDDPNPACLAAIAQSLEVERLIYGDVSRTSAGDDFNFSLSLHQFNTATGSIEHSVTDTVASVHQDIDDLRDPAQRWVQTLYGAPRTGTLVVSVNVPNASVSVDGSPVGTTDDSGTIIIEDVAEGQRTVSVTAEGHEQFSGTVEVEAYGEASLTGELIEGDEGGGGGPFPTELVVGVSLLIAAAAFAGVWIYSGLTVYDHQNSEEFNGVELPGGRRGGIRGMYGTSVGNICDLDGGTPREEEICNEAATMEIVQFVFMGLTALAGGVGLYFVVAGASADDSDAEAASIELVPSISPEHAYLGARVRF